MNIDPLTNVGRPLRRFAVLVILIVSAEDCCAASRNVHVQKPPHGNVVAHVKGARKLSRFVSDRQTESTTEYHCSLSRRAAPKSPPATFASCMRASGTCTLLRSLIALVQSPGIGEFASPGRVMEMSPAVVCVLTGRKGTDSLLYRFWKATQSGKTQP